MRGDARGREAEAGGTRRLWPNRLSEWRRGRALRTIALAWVLVLYAAASLWPYDWDGGRLVRNAATPLPEGGVGFPGPGIALARETPTWLETAIRTGRLALSLRVRPLAPEQFGPARIFTLSASPFERNLTVAQERADLIVRLRTPRTDANGRVEGEPVARVRDLFLTPGWIDLDVVIEPGRLRITVDGATRVEQALPRHPLVGWDVSHRVALGNEMTYNRPWLGEIARAVVRTGERSADHAAIRDLEFPKLLLITTKFPKLMPFRDFNPTDAVQNFAFYLPLGVLLGLLVGIGRRPRRWRVILGVALLVAVVSASLETLQLLVPRRAPSVDDWLFNVVGGACGAMLASWSACRLGVTRHA